MEIEYSNNKNDNDENDVDGETTTNDGNESTFCPLFMTGLPRDFSTNPALAAIASLMDDHDSANDDGDAVPIVAATNKSAAEKIIAKRSKSTKYKPYTKSNRKTKLTSDTGVEDATTDTSRQPLDRTVFHTSSDLSGKSNATTIGEASLFMKMWKL